MNCHKCGKIYFIEEDHDCISALLRENKAITESLKKNIEEKQYFIEELGKKEFKIQMLKRLIRPLTISLILSVSLIIFQYLNILDVIKKWFTIG